MVTRRCLEEIDKLVRSSAKEILCTVCQETSKKNVKNEHVTTLIIDINNENSKLMNALKIRVKLLNY